MHKLLAILALVAGSSTSAAGFGLARLPIAPVAPVFVAAPTGDPRLFVVERAGRIRIYQGGTLLDPPFLDIHERVDADNEGGLLSVAFPPDYAQTRAFYVYYTAPGAAPSRPQSRISRFRASAANPNVASSDPADEKILLTVEQPYDNHNGGTVAFGPDGMLYMGFGDGGLRFDPLEAAQDPGTLLGKMIRIDVSFSSFDDDYAVPPDNPYVGAGEPLDEIWDLGLRNPFRFSFDREDGALYIGDVGQDSWEEVNVEPPPDTKDNQGGRNYGWDVMEGPECFTDPVSPHSPDEPACHAPQLVLPVYSYDHLGEECSITGGVVYRGSARPALDGLYLFSDWCSARIWSLRWDGAGGMEGDLVDRTDELQPDQGALDNPVAFGEDGFGEVYVVDQDGDIYQLVPEPAGPLLLGVGVAALLAAQRTQSRGTRKRSRSSASGEPGSGRKS